MTFGEAVKSCFSKYVTFKGRARRSEYWYFALFCFLVTFGASLIAYFISPTASNVVSGVLSIALLLPSLAASVRRLHDVGKTGKLYLLFYLWDLVVVILSTVIMAGSVGDAFLAIYVLITIGLVVLAILMLVYLFRDSQPGDNQYGPNPKGMYIAQTPVYTAPAGNYNYIASRPEYRLPVETKEEIAPAGESPFFCHKCGAALVKGSDFCHKCGAQVYKG